MTEPTRHAEDVVCSATTFVKDDRWGGWQNRCQLPANHQGEHRHAMSACDPAAWLVWEGRYDPPKRNFDEPVVEEDGAFYPAVFEGQRPKSVRTVRGKVERLSDGGGA